MRHMETTIRPELLLSKDLYAGPKALQSPKSNSPRILVIGGGVTGLVTAWFLLDRGYHVTVISKEWASYGSSQRLTSQISGALWELPPTACGGVNAVQQELAPGDLKTVQQWALDSFAIYRNMAESPQIAHTSGVSMKICSSFHTYRVVEDQTTLDKMRVAEKLSPLGFEWGMELADKYGANIKASGGIMDIYEHLAPIIDTDVAMAFLMRLIQSKGAKLQTDVIIGRLLDQEPHLLETYHADAIVNATGLARETAGDDSVYPLRGAVLRVINDGSDFPKVESSLIVAPVQDEDGVYDDIAFIVPRNDNILILGSIEQPHQARLDLTPESPEIKEMRARCEELLPCLKKARLDPDYPLAQGLRPYRDSQIRVEREKGQNCQRRRSKIIHCYGHGGAGWSTAFGSSRQCALLVEGALDSKIQAKI